MQRRRRRQRRDVFAAFVVSRDKGRGIFICFCGVVYIAVVAGVGFFIHFLHESATKKDKRELESLINLLLSTDVCTDKRRPFINNKINTCVCFVQFLVSVSCRSLCV